MIRIDKVKVEQREDELVFDLDGIIVRLSRCLLFWIIGITPFYANLPTAKYVGDTHLGVEHFYIWFDGGVYRFRADAIEGIDTLYGFLETW